MLKSIFVIAFTLLLNFSASLGQWTSLNSGSGRSLDAVSFPSVNTGYVLPFMGPVIRTVDGGNSWDSLFSLTLNGSGQFDNDISFVNDSLGFVATHDNVAIKLYKISDSGNTCIELN